jgi:dCTP deaminase
MILTHDVILREIESKRIVIEPFSLDQVGPASIDLHLADEIRVMEGGPDVIDMTEEADYRLVTQVQQLDRPYLLKPGETIHGITRERIRLPDNICGWLEGRSRFARLGLMIHVTSGFVAPGINNRQVLEMANVAGRPLAIHAGTRICQLVLQRAEGHALYQGRFAQQARL